MVEGFGIQSVREDLAGRKFRIDANPLVSVIITTHNYAHFLADAIRSALSQTADLIEVIVIDDGSSDDPATVVANFSDVCLIRQQNLGLAAARNAGWQAARGKYVVFLDADDRLLPDAVAINLHRFATSPDCGFVFGGHQMVDVEGRAIGGEAIPQLDRDPYRQLLEGNCIGMHAAVMYRCDRIADVGGFDQTLRACEDYDLYLRLARQFQIGSSLDTLADYRLHGRNMSLDLPLMLHSVLDVLHRQRPNVSKSPDWQEAYKRGVRDWKLFYIERYAEHVRDRAKRSQSPLALASEGLKIFWLAPMALMWIVFGAICRRALGIIGRW